MSFFRLIVGIIACYIAINTSATTTDLDGSKPVGWGSVNGTVTGSDDENPVTVTSADELVAALKSNEKKTIYVKGTVTFDKQISINGAQDKTIYGLPGSTFSNTIHSDNKSESGIMLLKNCKNMILRNLTFKGAGAYDIDGKDNLTLQGCQYIWVDHCDFQDGVDGNLDCNQGTDYVSITWCRFHYLIAPWAGGSGGSNDHRFTNLIGSSDSNADKDEGHLRITYAYCWWDEGCCERMPRIRFGQVHIANCLYNSSVSKCCVGVGYRCNAYVEKCAFVNQKNPWKNYATKDLYTDYNITVTDCIGTDDVQSHSGDIDYFNPYAVSGYTLAAIDKDQVEATVKNGAGAILDIKEGQENTTGLSPKKKSLPTITNYYTLSGKKAHQQTHGICIGVGKDYTGKTIARKLYK